MTTITRRQAISAIASIAAVAGAGSALALAGSETLTTTLIAPQPALAAAPTVEELQRMLAQMPPMKRLFMTQQLQGWDDTDPRYLNVFRDGVPPEEVWNDVYPDWLSGFDAGIIAKFETGEWRV